ncbi:RWD domain-containing protein 1, partial [Nowakowskiella sp. JEL0078]
MVNKSFKQCNQPIKKLRPITIYEDNAAVIAQVKSVLKGLRKAMDHLEEQQQELEALKSIYFDEFEELKESPISFRIRISLDITAPLNSFLILTIQYSETYPETAPNLSIAVEVGSELDEDNILLSEQEISDLKSSLETECEANLGMAMVFTLVSFAKEHVEELVRVREEAAEAARDARIKAEEDAELARYQGTRVNVDTFSKWRSTFEKEIAEIIFKEGKQIDLKKGKLTGRQLFEKDVSLVKSDMAFAEEGDIEVDLALFEDMDGLDDDDDDEERNT